jgi:dihydroneopterin aldolase/2-amino-4-hydroxy-6-hydroxymethyldihydropteridine diphosphokinase/dihydropteroate synthase
MHLTHISGKDEIRVNDLSLTVLVDGGASWPSSKPKLQPVLVSLVIAFDISKVAETDDLSFSIDYSDISKQLTEAVSGESYSSLEALSDSIFHFAFRHWSDISELSVKVLQMKSPIHSQAIGLESSQIRGETLYNDRYFVQGLTCQAILGVNACERVEKQNVSINLSVERQRRSSGPFDFRVLTRRIYDVRQHSLYSNFGR